MATKVHPAADAFPMMTDSQYESLKTDIAQRGLQEPIVYWRDCLLDGRNRLKACVELGIDPDETTLADDADPVAYVVSLNIHRRHLTTPQRAMVAAKLAKLKRGGQSGNRNAAKSKRSETNGSNDPSVSDAAALLQVSEPSVKRAKHVISKGSREVVESVQRGELNLNQATNLVDAVPDKRQQSAIVAKGKSAVRDAVAPKPKEKEFDENEAGHRLRDWLRKELDRWPEKHRDEAAHWIRQILEKEFNL